MNIQIMTHRVGMSTVSCFCVSFLYTYESWKFVRMVEYFRVEYSLVAVELQFHCNAFLASPCFVGPITEMADTLTQVVTCVFYNSIAVSA